MSIEFFAMVKQATELYTRLTYFVLFNDILVFSLIFRNHMRMVFENQKWRLSLLKCNAKFVLTIFQDCRNSISSHFLLMFPEALIGLKINFYRGLWPLLPDDISLSCLQPNEKTYKIMLSLQWNMAVTFKRIEILR